MVAMQAGKMISVEAALAVLEPGATSPITEFCFKAVVLHFSAWMKSKTPKGLSAEEMI